MKLLLTLLASIGIISTTVTSPIPTEFPELETGTSAPHESFSNLVDHLFYINSLKASPTPKTNVLAPQLSKSKYTIVLVGDSMIDTFGSDNAALASSLKAVYPQTAFTLYNYGLGGTPLTDAITRIVSGMTKERVTYPAIASLQPDIIIIESCAYNQTWSGPEALDVHWLTLANAIDTIHNTLPQARILLFATIAPNSDVFGDGAANLHFDTNEKLIRTTRIRAFLDNTVKFARSQNIPLADAYTPSLASERQGNLQYINSGDHIHYSDTGRVFAANIITRALITQHVIK